MRQLFVIAPAVLLSVASAFCVRMATRRPPSEALVPNTAVIDLGTVKQGEARDGEFVLTNDASRPITIERVDPTCSCTVTAPTATATTLPPGQAIPLRASFHAGTQRGPTSVSVMVTHRLDGEPRSRTIELKLAADVTPDYDVDPPRPAFVSGTSGTGSLTLKPRNKPSLTVKSVYTTHPSFVARSLKDTPRRGEWTVEIRYDAEKLRNNPASYPPQLYIETDSIHQPTYDAPLLAPVEASTPQELSAIGVSAPQEPAARSSRAQSGPKP